VSVRLLHVVATGQRRGAEIFAADLIRALPGLDHRVAVLGGPWQVDFGAPVVHLPRGPAIPGLRVRAAAIGGLRRIVEAWAPDVIQAHGGDPLKHVLPAARGTPVVYRRIGWADPRATRGSRRVVYGFLMRRAARVIAVADAVREETVAVFRVPHRRVETIPMGIDPRRVEPTRGREASRRALGVPEEVPVVLSVGSLTWEKDPLSHLNVVARAARATAGLVHLMVGDGPLRGAVERVARETTPDVRVLVLGTRADVGDLYAASDVLVLASRSEGMPGVVIEAGMAGLPVAAFALAGVPEVVADGATGLLAPGGDLDALAERLVRLLSDRDLRRTLGEASRARCLAEFHIDRVATRYAEVYGALASARVSPAG
jgi:glycosyltransferase involved in cell wall biosynthesis